MNTPLCTIVGFGPGIGTALAELFGKHQFDLALLSRSPDKHAAALDKLTAAGIRATPFAANAADEESLNAAFEQVRRTCGETTVLIYNAFAFRTGKPTKITATECIEDLRTNVGGAITSVRAVVPAMQASGAGTILFTGGGLALEPAAIYASVSLGKAALRNYAFALAQELTPAGIHVGTVTICGMVKAGTHFDPAKIAPAFLALHEQPPGSWTMETMYR